MSSNFFAVLSRMKYIERWGLMRKTRSENLSEHSLETAFIAHALALIGNVRLGRQYDADRIALLAMYHDATEVLTGDLPTPIKYYNPEIKTAYKKIESAAAGRFLDMLPEDLRAEYARLFAEDSDEGRALVKAADKISAYIKCLEEKNMGNREFDTAATSTKEIIDQINLPEVQIFMDEFMDSFERTLDEQTVL